MILDTTSKTIEVILGGAITTNQLEIIADWVDTANGSTFAPGGTSLLTNGGTAVTVVGSPGASTQRQVKSLTVYNADTVAQTVIVRMFDGTNRRRHIVMILGIGELLLYTPEGGWRAMDTLGNLKQSLSGTTANITDIVTGTFTPTDVSGAGLSLLGAAATYIKIGKRLFVDLALQYPSTANGTANRIGGFPFTVGSVSGAGFRIGNATYNIMRADSGNSYIQVADGTGTPLLNSALSGTFVVGPVSYFTT